MQPDYQKYFCILIVALLCSCNQPEKKTESKNENIYLLSLKKDSTLKYAKRFSISENKYCKLIYLFGNSNITDTTAIYIILKDSTLQIQPSHKTFIFKSGCKKIASLSSIYTTMLCDLNEIEHISAIENIDYYNNKSVLYKFQKGLLQELVKSPELNVEKTIILKPDIIFSFGMGNPSKDMNEKISQAQIPYVIAVDHLEQSPLARSEWIKFFGAFVNKSILADSLFNEIEQNYLELKLLASSAKSLPSVFSEIKFGEIWYVPGGKSFAATFYNDAHANYIWKDNTQTGSLHLSFEEVYNKAKDADFWLNMALVKTKKELLSLETRYSEFKSFQTGNLYNNIKTSNANGYSDYWETGILYPNRVLRDLIVIFHPELKSRLSNELYYYKKLE